MRSKLKKTSILDKKTRLCKSTMNVTLIPEDPHNKNLCPMKFGSGNFVIGRKKNDSDVPPNHQIPDIEFNVWKKNGSIEIRNATLSTRHAQIQVGKNVIITDMKSLNGLAINGVVRSSQNEEISTPLKNGDKLLLSCCGNLRPGENIKSSAKSCPYQYEVQITFNADSGSTYPEVRKYFVKRKQEPKKRRIERMYDSDDTDRGETSGRRINFSASPSPSRQ